MSIANEFIDDLPILGVVNGYEEQPIEVGGDDIMKWSFNVNIGRNGAWVDGDLTFKENLALRNLRDNSDTTRFAEFRHIRLVELSTTQRGEPKLKYVDEEITESHYPHGVVADYMITGDGLRVVIESLDIYANDSLNIRLQTKHRQVVAIPIIENGSLLGLGIVVKVDANIKKLSYRA